MPASSYAPTTGPRSGNRRSRRAAAWLLVAGILLLAFNLRTAVTSLGAVLGEVTGSLGLSPVVAGLLTTLPVLCFAGMGALAAPLARRFGPPTILAAALTAILLGLLVRVSSVGAHPVVFTVMTAVALSGMAVGNVLIPATVRAYFPGRIGVLTAAYTTVLAIGTTVPAALTVPISEAAGSWRLGLGSWAATAAIALIPWLVIAVRDRRVSTDADTGVTGRLPIARSRIAWWLAVFFGLQSTQAYASFGWLAQIFTDAGVSPTTAGLLLSVLPVAGVPMSLALPTIVARLPDPKLVVLGCGACYLGGYAGLLIAPTGVPLLWVLLLGLGGGSFPLALTLIAMRSSAPETTASLSGFVQSVGYLLAAIGPFLVGLLHDLSEGWTVPILFLAALTLPLVIAGVQASRPRTVDAELASK